MTAADGQKLVIKCGVYRCGNEERLYRTVREYIAAYIFSGTLLGFRSFFDITRKVEFYADGTGRSACRPSR